MLYDVIIIGGALSGGSAAMLLLRKNPALRVLIVEKSPRFTRKVGEATVEVSGYFLTRGLGLTQFLNETQLAKQGLRFWFANDDVRTLPEASEIGPRYQVRLPSFQVDRSVLDEEVLRRAVDAGATLLRPANVTDVVLEAGGVQSVTVRHGETTETFSARWVVDASGVACLLARKQGWWRTNAEHPTAACWGRWRGVKDWDGLELATKYPEWASATHGFRNTATNHVVGDGWWSWWIPLKGGDVSVGVVFDQRLVEWPQGEGNLAGRLKDFLFRHPVAREMLADAELIEGDVHWRRNLAYSSETYAGDGYVLVGDAAAFLDPFYSPGMDWISFTSTSAVDLIDAQMRGEAMAPRLKKYNRDFSRSYQRWFAALYKDKYEYIGEFDLVKLAFLLDLGLYYIGVVAKPFKEGLAALHCPPFSGVTSHSAYHVMRTYNRRFAAIARSRRERGRFGRMNCGMRHLAAGYTLAPGDIRLLIRPLLAWARLEIAEGWRSWWRAPEKEESPAYSAAKPAT
ncbi:MAG TPA: NAD(P)/FAD-dependent oxidoreductase [Chthoniobacterales bacterium]